MIVGDIPTAYGVPWFVSYAAGIAILFLVLRFAGAPIGDAFEPSKGSQAQSDGT